MASAEEIARVKADLPVAQLVAAEAFAALTEQEAKYALCIANACWAGAKICLLQASPESTPIFALLRYVFADGFAATKAAVISAGVSEDDWALFSAYACTFFDSLANYKSFGDTKFIPSIDAATFHTIVKASPSYSRYTTQIEELWATVQAPLYDLRPRVRQLGFPPDGISTYYSGNVTKEDAERVQRWCDSKALPQAYNSRVFKSDRDGSLTLCWASALPTEGATAEDAAELLLGDHEFEGVTIHVRRGDYAPLMGRVVDALEQAAKHAANDTQVAMLRKYADSFRRGSIRDHMAGSQHWVKDKGPILESYLGFIESYRDPLGVKGEWEGFAAVVNKATSAKFGALVDGAESLLSLLPWGKVFEKDRFLRPDFTALEVLAFGSSGIPAGINIPNYDTIRQVDGFKNVSLSNVLSARSFTERVSFLADADQDVYRTKVNPAFEVQVGLHELLGHGSGKTFQEAADGSKNFDPAADPRIHSWYKPGQSWDSVFGGLASAMEECRAEAVGLVLCVERAVWDIFGHAPAATGGDAEDVVYANWLNMARAGLLSLQFYNPTTKSFGQAHMQARYVLLRVMMEAGQDFVTIAGADAVTADTVATATEGEGGVHVRLDRSRIHSVGVPAVRAFLEQLQVYKATADAATGLPWFTAYSAVPDAWLPLRDLVISKRKPRQAFVQPVLEDVASAPAAPGGVTAVTGGAQAAVRLLAYAGSQEGLVDSCVRRYPVEDAELLALWKAEAHLHAY